jgi:hypothetical protein
MEYSFYCRDRTGSAALRWELAEAHWSFTGGRQLTVGEVADRT